MKPFFVFLMSILIAFSAVSCGKSKVSKMLDEYEKTIAKIEKISKDDGSLSKLSEKGAELKSKVASLEKDAQWTAEERERFLLLNARYAKAAAVSTGKTIKDGFKKIGL